MYVIAYRSTPDEPYSLYNGFFRSKAASAFKRMQLARKYPIVKIHRVQEEI